VVTVQAGKSDTPASHLRINPLNLLSIYLLPRTLRRTAAKHIMHGADGYTGHAFFLIAYS